MPAAFVIVVLGPPLTVPRSHVSPLLCASAIRIVVAATLLPKVKIPVLPLTIWMVRPSLTALLLAFVLLLLLSLLGGRRRSSAAIAPVASKEPAA